jgi:hypothetical protein
MDSLTVKKIGVYPAMFRYSRDERYQGAGSWSAEYLQLTLSGQKAVRNDRLGIGTNEISKNSVAKKTDHSQNGNSSEPEA